MISGFFVLIHVCLYYMYIIHNIYIRWEIMVFFKTISFVFLKASTIKLQATSASSYSISTICSMKIKNKCRRKQINYKQL